MKAYANMRVEYQGEEYKVIGANLEEELLCIGHEEGALSEFVRYENCKEIPLHNKNIKL